jgi:16S rRNA (cytosine967-C5)-methyltransferase
MPISPARVAAFDILVRVEREFSYATELLHAHTYNRLSAQDHALAMELVMGVLRWRSRLDAEIAPASSQPFAKLDLEILIALRLALYQFRWLDRIPKRAALHESVELVKRARKHSAAPFVNAVLRKLSAAAPQADRSPDSAETIASSLAHPPWLVKRWIDHYGLATAAEISRHDQCIPPTTIRLRTPTAETELNAQGIKLDPGNLLASARRVLAGDITNTKAFRNGDIVIQDEASQLVATLIGRAQGDIRILDCCAAPGGKTLAIADQNPSAEITAVEIHPHRARLLQNLVHGSKHNIATLIADATSLPFTSPYQRILADVPCSGTGTLSRNPEIKWRLKPEDLSDLQARQRAILCSALAHLSPGGRLVYTTCSLEKEENEDVVEEILARENSIRLLDCRPELALLKKTGDLVWPDPASLTRGPYLRTIPGIHPCDGFFAVIIEKK